MIIVSNSDRVTTLAAKKFGSPVEQTPRVLRKVGYALDFINLSKSALVDVKERYDPSLYRFSIFRTNG
jgi:hypothetical protein